MKTYIGYENGFKSYTFQTIVQVDGVFIQKTFDIISYLNLHYNVII